MSLPTTSKHTPLTRPALNATREPDSCQKVPEHGTWDTFFTEDTCMLKNKPEIIGVVAKTWHDIDDLDSWEEIERCCPGAYASYKEMTEFRTTGQPPRYFLLLTPSSPGYPPMLVHESELTLLDRALAFGDVVKKDLTSPLSGTIISVSTSVGLRHSFHTASEPPEKYGLIPDVEEQEVVLSRDWSNRDFVIYKNCWMGVVEEVYDDISVRLQDGSVVIPENTWQLEIPLLSEEEHMSQWGNINSLANASGEGKAEGKPTNTPWGRLPRPKSIPAPYLLSIGQTVTTKEANLQSGRWVYGAYNPRIPPIGVVVDVKTTGLRVSWLCQNMIVPGRFVPVPRPDMILETEAEISKLKKFEKSFGGFVDLDGKPFTSSIATQAGGSLEVGDRVRFRDLDAALEKYQGRVWKIPRSVSLGFEVNTFVVVESRTRVRVMWQDLTESVEEARDLVPYLNVDEHDVWPGEMVVIKEESARDKANPSEVNHEGRQQFQGVWQYFNDTLGSASEAPPTPDFIQPEKVGVVQTVNPAERVAKVIWFSDPKVEIAGNVIIPGSKTGPLGIKLEDASLYEVTAHQSMGVRRGDFVLIAPEKAESENERGSVGATTSNIDMVASTAQQHSGGQFQQITESLRGVVVGSGLLAGLGAALGATNHPQFQAVSRMLTQFPLTNNNSENTNSPTLVPRNTDNEDPYRDLPLEWIGEIVDLGLDGLITVRLGALDEPKEVRVPIERVHIIFTGEMDFDEPGDEDEDDEDDEYDSEETDEEDELNHLTDEIWRKNEALNEQVFYQGGERMENDGGEEAWSTDNETDDMGFGGDSVVLEQAMDLDIDGDTTMASSNTPSRGAESADGDKKETVDAKALSPPIPEAIPVPQAFSVPTSSRQLERFVLLDSPVPADHAFGAQPATPINPKFLRRINKEHAILSSSLPDGILVRTWESRIDLMRVLIIGPLNTPYELAPFVFDFHFSENFPHSPPVAHFHSWTGGIGRVNPNLYEDGKICLSLLGTWHAEKRNEGWSPSGSSVLQVLVSLMGLVLVREPYYNEAGFGVYVGSKDSTLNSALYSERAFILARGFVKHVLQRPIQGFEDEIKWLYMPGQPEGPELLKEVIKRATEVVERSSAPKQNEGVQAPIEVGNEGVGRVSAGALVLLKKHLEALEGILEGAGKREVVSEIP